VPKHARSFDGFDDQILALYAGGMTTREIQRHLAELYDVEVSDGLISEVTASIQDDVRAWQSRPLEELYVVVYLDAMQVAIRDQQVVRKKAVYVAVGVTLEGTRDCLGLWIEKTEGARFWTSVMTELRNRGVRDVLFVCTDGLTGFPEAIDAVFPQAVNQTCIVHLVRQSLRYLSWKERKSCAGELRRIAPPHCRSGNAPGTASSPSSLSRKRSAASSTRRTPSRACTCRSERRSRPAATSPTTTPHSD
jgi:putative transposase